MRLLNVASFNLTSMPISTILKLEINLGLTICSMHMKASLCLMAVWSSGCVHLQMQYSCEWLGVVWGYDSVEVSRPPSVKKSTTSLQPSL